jgi:hypothetical protein
MVKYKGGTTSRSDWIYLHSLYLGELSMMEKVTTELAF